MATQMTIKSTKAFLMCSRLCENIVVIPRSLSSSDPLSSKLLQPVPVHNQSVEGRDVSKCFRSQQHKSKIESICSTNSFGQLYARTFNRELCGCTQHCTAVKTMVAQLMSHRLWGYARDLGQGFSTSVCAVSQFGVGGGSAHGKPGTDHADYMKDWALRLANENGYLSWCRNTYLTTVVALAMIGEGKTVLAEQAAEGALLVAALNLTWGTYQYIYNIVQLRQKTGMSILGVLTYVSLALLHLALWFMVCAMFVGYTEDPDIKAIEEEAKAQNLE